ncbi:MAG: hypothetical protein QG620_693 [Patescibacteria group bacterium]|nr:hypothetical protein [Patescibacteria group bacterium]
MNGRIRIGWWRWRSLLVKNRMSLLLNLAFFIAEKIPIVREFTMKRLAIDFGLSFNITENKDVDFFKEIELEGFINSHSVYIADRHIQEILRTVVKIDGFFLKGKEDEIIMDQFQDGHLTSVYELRKILKKLK